MTGETDFTEYNGAINVSFEAKTLLDSDIIYDSDDKRGPVITDQKLSDEVLSTVAILNLNDLKSVKDQGWVRGKVNDVMLNILVDTGSDLTLLSKDIFDQIKDPPHLEPLNLQLYTANGTNLATSGIADITFEFESKLLSQSVIVTDNFRYECLLGKDFLIANKMAVDYGKMTLKFPDGFEVLFTSKQKQTATLISDLRISPKTTVAIQTSIKNADSDLQLITDGGFLASDKLFVPKIVTKVRNPSNRVTLQVTNITDQSVFIKAGTKIADLKPFREFSRATPTFLFDNNKVNINRVEVKIPTSVITEEDLGISHLSAEQKAELVETINDVGLTAEPVLVKVTCVKHRIDVGDAHPIKQTPYRVPETKKQIIDDEVEKMLVKEVIRPSVSPWSSPIALVTKPDGSTRFCIDFRKVNLVTKKDAYPLPRIEETLNALGGSKYFTTLDLQSGYWQVPFDEASKEITAFSTRKGHFEFNVLPFGLSNAAPTFQRLMDYVLSSLHWSQCLVYLDDVIIFSRSFSEH